MKAKGRAMKSNRLMALILQSLGVMKCVLFATAFAVAIFFIPLISYASPFVDSGTGGKATREGGLGPLPPPPLPGNSHSQPAFNEAVKEDAKKDITIDVLGFIGEKVVVSVNGKVSAVRDGSEINGCLVAFPDLLCTEREKERHRAEQNKGKLTEGNASIKEKTLTPEKGTLVPGSLP